MCFQANLKQQDCPLPADDFEWIGYDGSSVRAHRAKSYGSLRGTAVRKIQDYMKNHADAPVGIVLWGVGNHGGGPSVIDMENIKELQNEENQFHIVHSTLEQYFAGAFRLMTDPPRHEGDLNAWAVGSYTSQIRIKQKHRQLESELYVTEKMLAHAAIQGALVYPEEALSEDEHDLMFSQFHDILPSSSIPQAEESSLRMLDHGLEICSRLKTKAF